MAKIVKLNVMISASTKGLSAGISKAQGLLNTLERHTRKMRTSLGTAFTSMGNIGTTAFKSLGVAAVGAAAGLAYLTKNSIEAIGDANDFAKSVGLSYNQLRRLQKAAQLSGVDLATMNVALMKMSDVLGTAFGGNKSAIEAFEKIGLDVKKLEQMNPEQQFVAIAEAINKIQDPSQKIAAARDIFGRSGGSLISFFGNVRSDIITAGNALEFFGITLNQMDVERVDAAGDAMGEFAFIVEGIGNQLARVVAPWLLQISEDTIKWLQSMGGVGAAVDIGVSKALESLDAMLNMVEDIEIAWLNASKAVNDFYLNIYKRDPNSDVAQKQNALITDRRLAGIPEHRREQARALLEKQGGFVSESPNVAAFNEQKALDDAYNQRMAEIANRKATRGTLGDRFANWRANAEGGGIMQQVPAQTRTREREDPALQVLRNIEANTGKNKIAFAGPN